MPCGSMQVFERLWGTNELLSSFDSINCLPPSGATGVPNDQTSWLHADQAPLRRGFFCIQASCGKGCAGPICSAENFPDPYGGLGGFKIPGIAHFLLEDFSIGESLLCLPRSSVVSLWAS